MTLTNWRQYYSCFDTQQNSKTHRIQKTKTPTAPPQANRPPRSVQCQIHHSVKMTLLHRHSVRKLCTTQILQHHSDAITQAGGQAVSFHQRAVRCYQFVCTREESAGVRLYVKRQHVGVGEASRQLRPQLAGGSVKLKQKHTTILTS